MAKILVADDERGICEAFARLLEIEGHAPLLASTGRGALDVVRRERPAAVFLDVQMPDLSGLDALEVLTREAPEVPVIVMTAHGSMHTAKRALELGAYDYLGKPLELPEIRALLERVLNRKRDTSTAALSAPDDVDHGPALLGRSRAMQDVFKMVSLLADNDLTVLITGESGVGKDLVAQALHRHGSRAAEPFVAVNCAAIPEQLLESELFGHEKGAFTGAHARRTGRFESAGAGTLFLDEISELPQHLQAKLLRVLQDRTFERVGGSESISLRARIVAATSRHFDDEASTPLLRRDFYYRLSLVNLHVPPLRDRTEDIPDLARHFLAHANREIGRNLADLDAAAIARLLRHPWPGNVRELEHTIKRSALTARGATLRAQDLQFDDAPARETGPRDARQRLDTIARAALVELLADAPTNSQPYRTLVGIVEQAMIDEALRRCDGNQVAASGLLGINRTTLRNKHGD